MELLLIRHGETEWSALGRHTGTTDLPLVEAGRRQAAALRDLVGRHLAGRAARAVASPLRRARETAALIAPDLPADVSDLLREQDYGAFEGLTIAEIRARAPGWSIWRDPCPGGESVAAVGARADRFLAAHAGDDGPVLVFSHGHLLRVLAARALGLSPSEGQLFKLATASLSVIRDDDREPRLWLWNATAPGG